MVSLIGLLQNVQLESRKYKLQIDRGFFIGAFPYTSATFFLTRGLLSMREILSTTMNVNKDHAIQVNAKMVVITSQSLSLISGVQSPLPSKTLF